MFSSKITGAMGPGHHYGPQHSSLPITLPIFHRIVWAASQLADSFFNTCRFQAMCLFAFYTFARVGEITASGSGTTINLQQVSKLVNDKQEAGAFKVTFLNCKPNYNQSSFSLVNSCQTTCFPVQNLLAYLQARGHNPDPFFKCLMALLRRDQFLPRSFPWS